jgi:hypothetical protein
VHKECLCRKEENSAPNSNAELSSKHVRLAEASPVGLRRCAKFAGYPKFLINKCPWISRGSRHETYDFIDYIVIPDIMAKIKDNGLRMTYGVATFRGVEKCMIPFWKN